MNKIKDLFTFGLVITIIVAFVALGIMIAYVSLPIVIITIFFVVCYIIIMDKLRKEDNEHI